MFLTIFQAHNNNNNNLHLNFNFFCLCMFNSFNLSTCVCLHLLDQLTIEYEGEDVLMIDLIFMLCKSIVSKESYSNTHSVTGSIFRYGLDLYCNVI